MKHVLDPLPPLAYPVRAPKPYSGAWVLALVVADLTMFTLSSYAAIRVVELYWSAGLAIPSISITARISILVWVLLFLRLGLYRRSFALSMRDELYYTITALCLGVAPLLGAFTLVPSISSSRAVLLVSLLFSVATVGTSRAALNALRDRIDRLHPKRIAIVGHPRRIPSALEALQPSAGSSTFTIEVEDIDLTLAHLSSTPGTEIDEVGWFRQALNLHCDRLILTEMPPPSILPYLLEAAARHEIELAIAPPRIRAQAYSLSLQTDGRQVLIVPKRLSACEPPARLLKRITDIIIASAAYIIFSPLMPIISLAIMLESGTPILYRQERVGRDGKVFEMLKFRSMRTNAEDKSGPVWRSIDDTRATRVGTFLRRTSLDELPQLLNVLRGDMSIVGPRPERPFFVERFRKHLPRYDERLLVRPGITGWSQIHLKRNIDLSRIGEKLSYDLFYIENWSLFMDLSIILKTAAEFLFHRAS
jgi:exopolysaccharide biosynthesis polyprenyl glycosylphosphotransferase